MQRDEFFGAIEHGFAQYVLSGLPNTTADRVDDDAALGRTFWGGVGQD